MFGRSLPEAPPMSQRQEMRVFVGFLVQPLVAALCASLVFLVVLDDGKNFAPSDSMLSDSMWAARAFGLGAGVVAFFVTALAAVPLFVWLRRRGPITLAKTLVGGVALGNLLTVAVPLLALVRWPGGDRPSVRLSAVVVASLVGLTCAAAFWWIAGRHLPRASEPSC